jgi:hypothetical protein
MCFVPPQGEHQLADDVADREDVRHVGRICLSTSM